MRGLGDIKKWLLSWIVDLHDNVTFYRAPDVLTAKEALQFRALVRWGDGETTLAYERSTTFQSENSQLALELKAVINNPSPDVLLCFIPKLVQRRPFRGQTTKYRRFWTLTAFMMRRSRRRHQTADALMFRKEGNFEGLTPLLQRLGQVQRVLVVSANPKDARDLEAKLARHSAGVRVSHVLVPKVNAYGVRDALFTQLKSQHPPPDIALLSAGPVGKCLVPDLLALWPTSSQIVDTGHLFDHLSQQLKTQA
jgi:hypothetical protein